LFVKEMHFLSHNNTLSIDKQNLNVDWMKKIENEK